MEMPTKRVDMGTDGDSNNQKKRVVDMGTDSRGILSRRKDLDMGNIETGSGRTASSNETLLPPPMEIPTATDDSNNQKNMGTDCRGAAARSVLPQKKWVDMGTDSGGTADIFYSKKEYTSNGNCKIVDLNDFAVWKVMASTPKLLEEVMPSTPKQSLEPLLRADACVCDDSGKIVEANQLGNGIKNGDLAVGKKLQPLTPEQVLGKMLKNCPYSPLMRPLRTWEEKVVAVLNVVRCRELTERNPKTGHCVYTRFHLYNIAFFDLDKESEVVHGTLFRDLSPSKYRMLDHSANVISIKVAESDVRYPISIYGTVLARDKNDYRCVYLFKRGRDDPQIITRKNRMLALTGPYRALGGSSNTYFEFHLKIKGEGIVDEDFSKGLQVLHAYRHTSVSPCTFSLKSYLSTVDMVCMPVECALEASIGVNFLNGESTFNGKIFASTTGIDASKMVLYDSQVAGTNTQLGSGGTVSLSRHIVAVPMGEDLLLYFSVCDSYNKSRHLKFVIGQDVDERNCNLGTYSLLIKIIWKGVFRQRQSLLKQIGNNLVLW